jgi:hypothetical protein
MQLQIDPFVARRRGRIDMIPHTLEERSDKVFEGDRIKIADILDPAKSVEVVDALWSF